MENLEIILSLATTALSLAFACVAFAVKLYKKIKENTKEKGAAAVLDAVLPLVEIAETLGGSGEDKKEYVLTKVSEYAENNDIGFDAAGVSEKIEQLIGLSKQVNKRK